MRILLAGANGMLARAVRKTLSGEHKLFLTDVGEMNILKPEEIRRVCDLTEPELILNCAAYTQVDKAEEDEAFARKLNAEGPANLARECAARKIPLVHISTDFVFFGDGSHPMKEDDPASPRGVYAVTKREGELEIEKSGCEYLIVRTAWLYGVGGKNFPLTMLNLAKDRDLLTVVSDQVGSPTFTNDLAWALKNLIAAGARGFVHFTNDSAGGISWYDLACATVEEARKLGLLPAGKKVEVKPVSTSEFPRPAPRPAFSVLCLEKFTRLTGLKPPEWREALVRYLKEL
ncbi:dTDP-4-dehydrorhamnose reductase [bacterium]|jgi:dTDP-4-dehydrorhamnose reductase|nr:dTDP-4-dehydrorhamnose reductase [bacterium]